MSTQADQQPPESAPGGSPSAIRKGDGPRGQPWRRSRKILIGVGVLAALALGVFAYWFFFMRGIVFTDDARISGHLVDLAPEINGRVIAVPVYEGHFVHKGDIIFQLDPSMQQAALNKAEASLVAARAALASSEAKCAKTVNGSRPEEVRAAEATLRRLQNEEELARLDFERTQTLFQRSTVSQDDLDRARTLRVSAHQSVENATQNLSLLQQGSRAEDIAGARADVDLARSQVAVATAAVESARSDLARCTVNAPFDGWVVRRWLEPGAMPLASQPVVSLFDPATLRVDANIEEKYLHDVAIGDQADISVDSFPDLRLQGRVTQILRATNSQFSLVPAEGVSGTFIKVTQRVPLRIAVKAPPDLPLGPGLSVELRIRSGTSTGAPSTHDKSDE